MTEAILGDPLCLFGTEHVLLLEPSGRREGNDRQSVSENRRGPGASVQDRRVGSPRDCPGQWGLAEAE